MKYLLLIILIFIFGCQTEFKKITKKYSDGSPEEIYLYKNKSDTTNFQIFHFYPTKQMCFKGTVQKNKFVGQKIWYYEDSSIRQIDSIINPCEISNCDCDAVIERYRKDGTIKDKYKVLNNQINGTVLEFDSVGKLETKYEMTDGKRNGMMLKYFENGVIGFKANFLNDTIQGFALYFYDTGDTLKRMRYSDGEMSLPYTKWLKNGLILNGDYFNDKQNVIWTWKDKSGKIVKKKYAKYINELIVPD
jgi:antitoxin component YwqK of YwqJK toxin-antitoxin module